MSPIRPFLQVSLALTFVSSAQAQWNPAAGLWGKTDPADLRIETYNVQDGICSTNAKVEGANNWCALARTIASVRPDVLLLQECGDNSGNGTGSNVDTVAQLTTTVGYFLHGGLDSFHGNSAITSWVQKYAPGYDLPFVFVTTENDGFNRNVILSRYPFVDLNGDGKATNDDIPTVTASQWAPGGDGGIRGFQFVEIDLPDVTYLGNLVVGGAHLKSGGNSSDHNQRVTAAENVSYVLRYWYNGNGGGVPDPLNKIADSPPATNVLPPWTPILLGGDWNEDEVTNGTKGPADWLTMAQTTGGTSDGTDRDGTDMTFDAALNFFDGSRLTLGMWKDDYVAWQDSIATLRLATIFNSASNPAGTQPAELTGYPTPATVSATASDHRTVFADLRLPIVDCNGNGIADTTDIANGTLTDANANQIPDECEQPPPPPFCNPGLAGVIACPCSNPPGGANRGCDNSSATGGSSISASGQSSLAADTVQITTSGEKPTATSIVLQGTSNTSNAVFGQGVRCVGGSLKRLYVKTASGGSISAPTGADLRVAAQSAALGDTIVQGTHRYYMVYYRDPIVLGGCPGASTFNGTNALDIFWTP